MILEHLCFCLANHVCVSHLLRGQPHLLECYYRNYLIETHMCVYPISKLLVFFTLQCELFTSCNVSNNASLVSAWTGGGRWSAKCGEACTGGGEPPKFLNLCGHTLWMTPISFFPHYFSFSYFLASFCCF